MDRMQMLDRKQLAKILNVSVRTIGRWRRNGKLPMPIVDEPQRPFWSFAQIEDWTRSTGTEWAKVGQSGPKPK